MTGKLTPAVVVVAVVVLAAVVAVVYWRTLGGGSQSSVDEKWTKPPVMKGPMQMPTIPPPPSGMARPAPR